MVQGFLALALVAGALFVGPAPAEAAGTIEVPATGRVSGGYYSTEWWAADDYKALAAATGKGVTFGGTFHNLYENDHLTNPDWSTTRDILDEVWRGQATPFANVGIDTAAYRIARGDYDARIAQWAAHVKRYIDLGGGRSVDHRAVAGNELRPNAVGLRSGKLQDRLQEVR